MEERKREEDFRCVSCGMTCTLDDIRNDRAYMFVRRYEPLEFECIDCRDVRTSIEESKMVH